MILLSKPPKLAMQITNSEIKAMRELMPDYTPGLEAMDHLALDPAIATVIVLYILKIGVNIFCDYTEPPAASGGTLPPAP